LTHFDVLVATEQRCWERDGRLEGRQRIGSLEGLSARAHVGLLYRTTSAEAGGQDAMPGARGYPVAPPNPRKPSTVVAFLRGVGRAVGRSTGVVVFAPGLCGTVVGTVALLRRKPLAVVVVGDPDTALGPDVLPGARGTVARAFFVRATQRLANKARVTRYVTQQALQAKYPSGERAVSFAATDATLDAAAISPRTKPDGPVRLLSVGTMDRPYKGFAELIEAMSAESARHGDRLQLTIVGTGRGRSELEGRASDLGVAVSFAGHLSPSQLSDLYRASDAFVLASWSEGMPRVLLEAMSHGLPVIASRVGGIPELIDNQWTFPPRDVRALQEKIGRLMRLTPRQWQDLSAHNLEVVWRLSAQARLVHQDFVEELLKMVHK